MAAAGLHVIGLDHSTGMLAVLRQKLKLVNLNNNCSLLLGDGEALPFSDESFDGVVCAGVLHHTPNLDKALEEQVRVLSKMGFYLLASQIK